MFNSVDCRVVYPKLLIMVGPKAVIPPLGRPVNGDVSVERVLVRERRTCGNEDEEEQVQARISERLVYLILV